MLRCRCNSQRSVFCLCIFNIITIAIWAHIRSSCFRIMSLSFFCAPNTPNVFTIFTFSHIPTTCITYRTSSHIVFEFSPKGFVRLTYFFLIPKCLGGESKEIAKYFTLMKNSWILNRKKKLPIFKFKPFPIFEN